MEVTTILKLLWLGGLVGLLVVAVALAQVAEHLRGRAAARRARPSSGRGVTAPTVAPEFRRRPVVGS
jgi:hypothetical protein